MVPGGHAALRALLGRVFTHKNMADACDRLVAHASKPAPMSSFMGTATCSAGLLSAAASFVELQEARHEADYNTSKWFTRTEATDLVDMAGATIAAFEAAHDEPHGILLQLAFLGPNQVIRTK
jgi:hypothetical protein